MEEIDAILQEMREFADADSQNIGRDVLRLKIHHFTDRIGMAVKTLIADRDNWRKQALDEDARANVNCGKSSQVCNEYEPMTLDEAIAHAEKSVNDTPCGRAHKQLANWLKELREIKKCNAAAMRVALINVQTLIKVLSKCHADDLPTEVKSILGDMAFRVSEALTAPPRNCDMMSLNDAKKVWFMAEIMPRLNGDLPLGKEKPFDEWFASQMEQ